MTSNPREYQRKYMRMRYHSDPEFRKKMIERSLEWQKANREWVNEYHRKYRKKYWFGYYKRNKDRISIHKKNLYKKKRLSGKV